MNDNSTRSLSGSTLTLPVLSGDGIGPEVVSGSLEVIHSVAAHHGIDFIAEELPIGLEALREHGSTVPDATVARLRHGDAAILGPLTTHALDPSAPNEHNGSAFLRTNFNLGANVRPASARLGIPLLAGAVDLVIVRENTEGFYADRNMFLGRGEFNPTKDVGIAVRVVTTEASTNVARVAFEVAAQRAARLGRRGRVTVVHKANVLRYSDGIFLDAVEAVSEEFAGIILDEIHVDAAATELIVNPGRFDVIVTTNMFGDILSNEAAALVGGLGFAPSLNVAADGSFALAQASHGSAPDIAGAGTANPVALLLSGAMLIDWLGEKYADRRLLDIAADIEERVARLLRMIGGNGSTVRYSLDTSQTVSALLR